MTSLEEKIGRMLLVGFRGTHISSTNRIVRDIQEYHIGGVILFDMDVPTRSTPRNIQSPEQLQTLVSNLQQYADEPLLIGIDQEGGQVNRLKKAYGFPETVSHAVMANMQEDEAQAAAEQIAEVLHRCGINMNFAPCVDLAVNPHNPIIEQKERSFSADAEIVSHLAEMYIQAHHQKNILCTIKHFPGHGSSQQDTHSGMADVSDTWIAEELQPYKYLISKELADMVMIAHVFHQKLDDQYPASLSFKIIQQLLREHLGWQGVIITDDLQMGAITHFFGFEKALELTINAGTDILLLGNNLVWNENIVQHTVEIVLKLIKEDRVSPEQIEQANTRIQNLKNRIK